MSAILNSFNAHNLPIFQPILMILVSKFMVYRALSDKTNSSLGLLSPLNFKSMCTYFNKNCVLVTNFKTRGFLEHFQMESGNAFFFSIIFHNGKSTFQTNKYFVNKMPSRLKNHLPKRPCLYFSRVFCHELQILFYKT